MTQKEIAIQQALQQLSQAFINIPFNRMLGLELNQLDNSYATMSFKMKPELVGNFLYGILHGGVISSVLDMAGGMVVMAAALYHHIELPHDELVEIIGKCSTVDLQVNYLRPGSGDTFTAKAWLTKGGKKISFVRMELCNQQDILIATGNGTYLLK